MAKLEDFLEVRFSDEIYEQFTIDFIQDNEVDLNDYIEEENVLQSIYSSEYYLIKVRDNIDDNFIKHDCLDRYIIGSFYVDINREDSLDLDPKDFKLLTEGNLFYRDIYKKGHDLYFVGEGSEYKVMLDDIEYIQKLE